MGSQLEFNWMLKLSPGQGLDEPNLVTGKIYVFSKRGYRIYPVGIPIDLVNSNWEALGRAVVASLTWEGNRTKGAYSLVKVYEGPERVIRTQGWRETLKSATGAADLTSYEGIRITDSGEPCDRRPEKG